MGTHPFHVTALHTGVQSPLGAVGLLRGGLSGSVQGFCPISNTTAVDIVLPTPNFNCVAPALKSSPRSPCLAPACYGSRRRVDGWTLRAVPHINRLRSKSRTDRRTCCQGRLLHSPTHGASSKPDMHDTLNSPRPAKPSQTQLR